MAKTVKVRIAVAVDDTGDWNSSGWKQGEANELAESAREPLSDSCVYWLTAELAVPEQTEVAAAVEVGGSDVDLPDQVVRDAYDVIADLMEGIRGLALNADQISRINLTCLALERAGVRNIPDRLKVVT